MFERSFNFSLKHVWLKDERGGCGLIVGWSKIWEKKSQQVDINEWGLKGKHYLITTLNSDVPTTSLHTLSIEKQKKKYYSIKKKDSETDEHSTDQHHKCLNLKSDLNPTCQLF